MNGDGSGPVAQAKRPRGETNHNLAGQRLGRKGLETRERLLMALLRLLEDPLGAPVTLTGIAREASVGLTNLYLYFPDFGALLLAGLERVMEDTEASFIHLLRKRWPDEALDQSCLAFGRAHYQFWKRHARILHMRNYLSETDPRIFYHRERVTRPLVGLLAFQMDACPPNTYSDSDTFPHMASVVLTGFERVATVVTNPYLNEMTGERDAHVVAESVGRMIEAEAHLVALAIRDQRAAVLRADA